MKRTFSLITCLLFTFTFIRAQAPSATITAPSGSLCTERVYTFSSTVTGDTPTAYTWSLMPSTGFTFVSGSGSTMANIKFSLPITYSVSLMVANASGTVATGVLTSVFKSARASYNASLTSSGFPVDIVLTNYSSNALGYNWDFFGAAPTQTNVNLVQSFPVSGEYTVALIALGSGGCNDTLSYPFVVDDISDVKLTNVFTPNNDGVNDVFRPITKGLTSLKVSIYNRWGNLMYEWDGVNGFWDGYTTAGIPCPDGVYFYVLEAKGFDGKTYKLKSNLTIAR